MPTSRGLVATVSGVAIVIAGRFLGMIELYIVGSAFVALALMALAVATFSRPNVEITRRLLPPRVFAGDTTRVEVTATNRGTRRTPVLRVRDPVDGTRGATLHIAPLDPDDSARAAYRLPTTQRGIVSVGPLVVEVTDGLRLAAVRRKGSPRVDLIVLPEVLALRLPAGFGKLHKPVSTSSPSGPAGDDFGGLRQYVAGDDLRSVHWLASAHRDDLVVRQNEPSSEEEIVVLLDSRRAAHTEGSFEAAVSLVASVVAAAGESHLAVRVVTTLGRIHGPAVTPEQRTRILEYLATVQWSAESSLSSAMATLHRQRVRGSVVAVVGRTTSEEVAAIRQSAPLGDGVTVISTAGFFDGSLIDRWDAALSTQSSRR